MDKLRTTDRCQQPSRVRATILVSARLVQCLHHGTNRAPPGDALGRTTVSVPFFAARVTLCTSAAYAVVWCLSSPSGVSHICVLCINQQTWSQTFSLSGTVNKTHHTPYKLKNCHVCKTIIFTQTSELITSFKITCTTSL